MNDLARADPWAQLKALTAARIALGRCGSGLPTRAVLDFAAAHALARDAVHQPFDTDAMARTWAGFGLGAALRVRSRADDRMTYLQRPDLGRKLAPASAAALGAGAGQWDLSIVVADGLSALAAQRHAMPLLAELLPLIRGLRLAPLVIAEQSRVALGDEIGALLQASLMLVLLGERPGLSSPDSLGAYLTFAPQVGRLDAERNCVSNIRPDGLPPADAARKLAWLIQQALARRFTGVALKDEADLLSLNALDQSDEPSRTDAFGNS